jgi:hypothetical protein
MAVRPEFESHFGRRRTYDFCACRFHFNLMVLVCQPIVKRSQKNRENVKKGMLMAIVFTIKGRYTGS